MLLKYYRLFTFLIQRTFTKAHRNAMVGLVVFKFREGNVICADSVFTVCGVGVVKVSGHGVVVGVVTGRSEGEWE